MRQEDTAESLWFRRANFAEYIKFFAPPPLLQWIFPKKPTTMSIGQPKRRVLFCGDVGIPESNREATEAHARGVTDNLKIVFEISEQLIRENIRNDGVILLRAACTGDSLEVLRCDKAFHHAPSLDHCFTAIGHSDKPVRIAKVASGKRHSLMLLTTGVVVLLTDGVDHGTVISGLESNVQDIAAGDSHFLCCNATGHVFSFGWSNEFGQFGDGTVWRVEDDPHNERILTDPKRLPRFGMDDHNSCPSIIHVAAGSHHSALLSATRTCVYAFGRGHRGQLGGPRCIDLQPSPKNIKSIFGVCVRCVAAAGDHTLFLLESGKLLACGDNTAGQIGTGKPSTVELQGSRRYTRPAVGSLRRCECFP